MKIKARHVKMAMCVWRVTQAHRASGASPRCNPQPVLDDINRWHRAAKGKHQ